MGQDFSNAGTYLLRRAVCGLTTKNYNRIFLSLTRNMRRDSVTHGILVAQLAAQTGESGEWPSDSAFREAWQTKHAYQTLNNPKIVHILKRLNDTFLATKMESLSVDSALSVEHILPQTWIEHWPLADGSKGLTTHELWTADAKDPRTALSRSRNAALQTIGNLTILTQALNSSVSNSAWKDKKPELLRHSLLPINQILHDIAVWDESAIEARSKTLVERALKLWPRA